MGEGWGEGLSENLFDLKLSYVSTTNKSKENGSL
jgi:hypothetical protein